MGYLQHKYTREYFTGQDLAGRDLGFGVLGADEWRTGGICHGIRQFADILPLRALEGKTVLEIGYGRGEILRYLATEKRIGSYVGVDFSEAAFGLALQTNRDLDPNKFALANDDALAFLKRHQFTDCFDVAFMLDVIEHIPTSEVAEMLPLIRNGLRHTGLLVVSTPFYSVDEDYIAQGEQYIAPSPSDLNEATRGMHCNKFTKERLAREMTDAGLKPIHDYVFQKLAAEATDAA